MRNKTILDLVDKYLKGTATDEDKKLVEFFLDELEKGTVREFTQVEKSVKKALLIARIQEGMHPKRGKLVAFSKQWIKWSAVAAVLIAVISAGYFFMKSDETNQVAQTPNVIQDIPPGRDAAILTLADGRQIILDSSKGTITTDNGIQIVNAGSILKYEGGYSTGEMVYNTITTAKGNQYQLELEDGTKVWLNSASSLRYPIAFKGKERNVELSGEGYFEVAYNKSKPFHVKVSEIRIEVLGTQFNVNAYADEPGMRTTLLEGAVRVSKDSQAAVLKPGQQAQVKEHSTAIQVIDNADIEAAVAWKNGLFNLKGVNVKEIMRQISRWYNVEIEYRGDVSDINFYGVVSRRQNVSELLHVMEETGTVDFAIEGGKIIVSK